MKILLISPSWGNLYGSYKNVARVGVFYPPLGLCYVSASLKQKGHDVEIIDMEAEGLNIEQTKEKALQYQPDLIGITSVSPLIDQAQAVAGHLKSLDKPIVLGGPHVTIVEREALRDCPHFDYGVIGEGEGTICELVEALREKRPLEQVKGILYRADDDVVFTGWREREQDIDSLPFPDRSRLKFDRYLWSVPKKGTLILATILSTRGCPFQCIFCSQDKMYGRVVRFRSPHKVVDEIEDIVKNTPARHIIFCDDTLTLKKSHILGICDEIIKRNIKITFEGWTRANTIDEEILAKMKEAGLARVSFGIESGDPQVLKIIKKGVTLEEVEKAYKIAKKLGLETRGSVMIGHPGETKETVWRTINFIRNLKELDHPYLNVAMPYPGTELREMALRSEHGIKLLSTDYTDLRRYDNAIMEINDLKPNDLIKLQRRGLLLAYMTPRRIWYNLTRAGLKSGLSNGAAFCLSFAKGLLKEARLGLWKTLKLSSVRRSQSERQ
ncbi:MAG: radical SAM protein [Candidatus Omnitrophica bacterium]|nr:radical SAM protein [Candidatus Omnitrophota bacterium]